IHESILENILLFKSEIENKYLNNNIYLKNSYNSLLITYEENINPKSKISELKNIYIKIGSTQKKDFNKWEIPVCYDIELGHDLNYLEKSLSIKKEEIVSLHSSKDYRVYNIGFLPGFLYLGGLDKKIHHPRKEKPVLNVPKGAVGIGGSQTGIYPNNSPGGWYIIGNSPINLFNINKTSPCFIKPGDKVKFSPISLKEHELIKIQVESNIYKPVKTQIND
ncbi:MAG: 5-oxoprolinase subunit PxpB, partial [Flavobacteriaceae bacterium]|nr:5-oxoprolinase subunit PxpB [Flavobacteriaceae bacterium]